MVGRPEALFLREFDADQGLMVKGRDVMYVQSRNNLVEGKRVNKAGLN